MTQVAAVARVAGFEGLITHISFYPLFDAWQAVERTIARSVPLHTSINQILFKRLGRDRVAHEPIKKLTLGIIDQQIAQIVSTDPFTRTLVQFG